MRQPDKGAQAERLACRFLQDKGLVLLERNYRSRYGEIDLVMRDATLIVFVEVRYRNSLAFGGAAASVDWKKRKRLVATALYYLQRRAPQGNARFDVVALGPGSRIEWIPAAFDAG